MGVNREIIKSLSCGISAKGPAVPVEKRNARTLPDLLVKYIDLYNVMGTWFAFIIFPCVASIQH